MSKRIDNIFHEYRHPCDYSKEELKCKRLLWERYWRESMGIELPAPKTDWFYLNKEEIARRS